MSYRNHVWRWHRFQRAIIRRIKDSMAGSHYRHWLGVTDRLTIDRLEQMDSRIQSHLTAL